MPDWLQTGLKQSLPVLALFLALVLFSGVWPPFAAVQTGSMAPQLQTGDLVYIVDEKRFQNGTEGGNSAPVDKGEIIAFQPPSSRKMVIHRAVTDVEKGENWVDQVNKSYLTAENCADQRFCPAPYTGYITKGDANQLVDQARGEIPVIRPTWIRGEAAFHIPYLGLIHTCTTTPRTC
jgi:signal peptidase